VSIIIPKIKLFFQIHIPPQTTTNTHPQTNNHHLQHVPTQHYSTTYQQSLITPHSTTVSATRPKGGWLRLLTSGRYPINATVMRGRAIARPSCDSTFWTVLHSASVYLRLDRRPQGGGREAAFISVHFGGSNIDDDFDGIVNNDVALHPFRKSGFSASILTLLVTF